MVYPERAERLKWNCEVSVKQVRKFIGTALPISFALALATVAVTPTVAQEAVIGTVYQTTNIRSGPGTRFEIVGQLREGDEVEVLGRDTAGSWLLVTADVDLDGWLPSFALLLEVEIADLDEMTPDAEGETDQPEVIVESFGRVNVRSGPGIDNAIVGELDLGERAQATARNNDENDWLLIVLEDETEGWVAHFTVNVFGDTTTLPILTPDATGDVLVEPTALARTRFNVRLHEDPALESPVIAIIPFSRVVTPVAISEDGEWLLVAYQDIEGWGAFGLFSLDEGALDDVPVRDN